QLEWLAGVAHARPARAGAERGEQRHGDEDPQGGQGEQGAYEDQEEGVARLLPSGEQRLNLAPPGRSVDDRGGRERAHHEGRQARREADARTDQQRAQQFQPEVLRRGEDAGKREEHEAHGPPPAPTSTLHASHANAGLPAAGCGRESTSGTVMASAPQAVSSAAARASARATVRRMPAARANRVTVRGADTAATAPRPGTVGRRGAQATPSSGIHRASSHALSATTRNTALAETAASAQAPRGMR